MNFLSEQERVTLRIQHRECLLLAGSSHCALAKALSSSLEIPIGWLRLDRFPDGEIDVHIAEEEVKDRDVFVLQTIAHTPNDYLLELLFILHALKRASTRSITAIVPYLGYYRQGPLTSKLIVDLLTAAGMTRLITLDTLQVQPLLGTALQHFHPKECIVIAPDKGSIPIATKMATLLKTELVKIHKQRLNPYRVNMQLTGNVNNKNVLIVDDLCATGATLITAATLCKEHGAQTITAAITHGLFIEGALNKIASSPIKKLFVTDSIPLREPIPSWITSVSIASLIRHTAVA